MIGSSELVMIFVVFIVCVPIIVLAYLAIRYLLNRKKTRGYEGKSALVPNLPEEMSTSPLTCE
jgi:hypothetical protein